MKRTHHLVSVAWEQASLALLWRLDGPAGSCAKERKASWTTVSDGAEERETETIESCAGDGPARPGQSFRSRGPADIQQSGEGFGELAFFTKSRAVVTS